MNDRYEYEFTEKEIRVIDKLKGNPFEINKIPLRRDNMELTGEEMREEWKISPEELRNIKGAPFEITEEMLKGTQKYYGEAWDKDQQRLKNTQASKLGEQVNTDDLVLIIADEAQPNDMVVTFHENSEPVASLTYDGDKFVFEGNVEKSAQIFIDYLNNCDGPRNAKLEKKNKLMRDGLDRLRSVAKMERFEIGVQIVDEVMAEIEDGTPSL